MRIYLSLAGIPALAAALVSGLAFGQPPAPVTPPTSATANQGPVDLDYAPPALHELSTQAAVKNSFTFDHNMLVAASSLLTDTDAETKQTIAKIDGVSVHMLRFGQSGIPDEAAVDAIRQAYHLRGWKHLVLAETPRSITLVTVAGNISPTDILRLRGKFGIPNFNAGDFKDAK